jgi:hypothetical protein
MGFLTFGDPLRVDLGENWWVDIRPGLSFGDLAEAQKALSKYSVSGGDSLEAAPDLGAYQLEMVAKSVISWNLTDEQDGPLPLSPYANRLASIRRLPQWAFNRIYGEVARVNSDRTPKEEAQFPARADDGDPGQNQDPASAAS